MPEKIVRLLRDSMPEVIGTLIGAAILGFVSWVLRRARHQASEARPDEATTGEPGQETGAPELAMQWQNADPETAAAILWVPARGGKLNRCVPVLVNEGSAVAVDYDVEFRIPLELLELTKGRRGATWKPSLGVPEHWSSQAPGPGREGEWHLFSSRGELTVKPGQRLPLGEFRINVRVHDRHPEGLGVHYVISRAWGERVEGVLPFIFRDDPRNTTGVWIA